MKNDDIRKAFDSLTPDDAARERMLKGIMAKSAAMQQETSAEPETAPWYIRFRAPIGFCAAAMACVMVFTIAVSNPAIVQNGSSRQQLLETRPAASETTAVRAAVTSAVTTSEAQITTYTTTSPLTGGTAASVTTEAAKMTETVVSTAAPPTTEPVVHSSLSTEATEAQLTTTATEAVITTTVSEEAVTTTTEVSTKPSLYGDLYDFNLVTWAGRSYATDYAVADYSQLSGKHLGSGVATGENAEGIYTILLYELQGVPVEDGFAVQYAGQTAYYIFYSID